jgi:hypothetical protein
VAKKKAKKKTAKKQAEKLVDRRFKVVVNASGKEIVCGEAKAKHYATQTKNCDDVDLSIFDEAGKELTLADF